MARKGWVMTPARKAYYASKKKKGGKGSLFPVTGSKKERAKWIAKDKAKSKEGLVVQGTSKRKGTVQYTARQSAALVRGANRRIKNMLKRKSDK